MTKNVLIMQFNTESKAYEAFSELKRMGEEGIFKGEQMAVLEHKPNHELVPKDFLDFTGPNNNVKDGLIGMVIGILGGPIGVLFGWLAGSIYGYSQDVKEIKESMSIFEETLKSIPENGTGLILIADGEDIDELDSLITKRLGGRIVRLSVDNVEKQIKDAQEAEHKIKKHAAKHWFNSHQED